jgi:hypothetical protein
LQRISHRERVESLISQFWKEGYLTLSRKHGSFLPAPERIGSYEIDALGKFKKNYVIGITLNEEDLINPKILAKINYLSSRNTIYSQKKVKLFVAVPSKDLTKAYELITKLPAENRDCIKLVPITTSSR